MEIVKEEVLYTYDAAVKRYEEERHHDWLCRQKKLKEIRKAEQERRRYMMNQKLLGFLMFVVVVIATALCGNLVCLTLAFPGVYVMFTDKMVIVNSYYRTHGGFDQWKI